MGPSGRLGGAGVRRADAPVAVAGGASAASSQYRPFPVQVPVAIVWPLRTSVGFLPNIKHRLCRLKSCNVEMSVALVPRVQGAGEEATLPLSKRGKRLPTPQMLSRFAQSPPMGKARRARNNEKRRRMPHMSCFAPLVSVREPGATDAASQILMPRLSASAPDRPATASQPAAVAGAAAR